jgi:adenylate cyclase
MSRDTPDWEAEGLLEGLGEPARESRIRLLRDLYSDGATLEELKRAVTEERLALLPVERILGGDEELLSGREVAERLDVDLERILRTRRALGLPVPGPDEPSYTEDEVRGLEVGLGLERAGFTEDARLEVARVIGRSMAQVAEAMRAVTVATFQAPGSTEREVSLRYAEAARSVAPVVGDVLQGALTAHLREQIRQDVVAATDIGSGRVAGAAEVAVAFADLVDFTRLGEELATEDVGALARRLEELAENVAEGPVRLVKMIGDAAMLVSRDPQALVEAVTGLVEAVTDEGDGFPPLRAGVAFGEAVGRGGDWYGRPVNLASRLTAVARPESVLGSEALRDVVGDDAWRWSFAGKRRLKGIRDETPLYRIRRRAAETVGG